MTRREPSLDRESLQRTLVAMLDRALPACSSVEYRLVGTAAALLHGVALPAGDVDILFRRREDVDAFGAALAPFPYLVAPALLPHGKQYFARLDVDGIEVELSTVEVSSDADTSECVGRGPWEHYALLPCGPYRVPTVALELRLLSELYRDRPDRYRPLIAHLREHGCDVDLLRRGLRREGLPQDAREEMLWAL